MANTVAFRLNKVLMCFTTYTNRLEPGCEWLLCVYEVVAVAVFLMLLQMLEWCYQLLSEPWCCVNCSVSLQACPRLSVLVAAPTKQTETASASLHAWNPARPDHAWLLRCADACEYNKGEHTAHSLMHARTHAAVKSFARVWQQRTLTQAKWVCSLGCSDAVTVTCISSQAAHLLQKWRVLLIDVLVIKTFRGPTLGHREW